MHLALRDPSLPVFGLLFAASSKGEPLILLQLCACLADDGVEASGSGLVFLDSIHCISGELFPRRFTNFVFPLFFELDLVSVVSDGRLSKKLQKRKAAENPSSRPALRVSLIQVVKF